MKTKRFDAEHEKKTLKKAANVLTSVCSVESGQLKSCAATQTEQCLGIKAYNDCLRRGAK